MPEINTFSIVAYDPTRGEWGVAVQSKFLGVGGLVTWAKAEAGAVATQSMANLSYGIIGLEMMGKGVSAREVIEQLTGSDEERELRQVGMVDSNGDAFSFTGNQCNEWAGHIIGDGFACQGNMLIPGTLEAMVEKYQQMREGPGELADWLVAALEAGQAAGGDKRGRQSACVLVVRKNGGYGGDNDRYLDLRVDDDPFPIQKLKHIVEIHHLYFGPQDPDDVIPFTDIAGEIQEILAKTGHYDGEINGEFNEQTRQGLFTLVVIENLEERWDGKSDFIDGTAYRYLRDKFGKT